MFYVPYTCCRWDTLVPHHTRVMRRRMLKLKYGMGTGGEVGDRQKEETHARLEPTDDATALLLHPLAGFAHYIRPRTEVTPKTILLKRSSMFVIELRSAPIYVSILVRG